MQLLERVIYNITLIFFLKVQILRIHLKQTSLHVDIIQRFYYQLKNYYHLHVMYWDIHVKCKNRLLL